MTLIGLDLGQMQSFSAASVLRAVAIDGPDGQPLRASTSAVIRRFDVRGLRRYPLGTSYAEVVRHIAEQARRPELHADGPLRMLHADGPLRICVDKTGCGAAVLEMIRTTLKPSPTVEVWGVVITGGKAVTRPGPQEVHVAKTELAGAIRQVLEDGRLKVPPQLEFAEAFRRELQAFTVHVTTTANETFSAAEGGWDDLVIAAALPIWLTGWLDSRQVPVIAGPGPPVFPGGYRSGSHASTFGGAFRPSRDRLFGRSPGSGATPYRR